MFQDPQNNVSPGDGHEQKSYKEHIFYQKNYQKKNISVNCTNILALKSLQSNMGRAKKTLHTLPFG